MLVKYDIDNYFKGDFDDRNIKYYQFNFDVFDKLKNLFTISETKKLEKVNKTYTTKIKALSDSILKKEFER